jgi:hypothetical protein
MRRGRNRRWVAVTVCALAALVSTSAYAGSKPVGTIRFKEGSVAVGVGYSWGHGVLTYKGRQYPFKITGLTAGELGGEKIHARGSVYHLKKLSDFSGTYTSAGAGATAAGGFDVEAMRNSNGVEIKIVSTTKGADIRAAVEGVTITLE